MNPKLMLMLFLAMLFSCKKPVDHPYDFQQIVVGAGPEDMVVDTSESLPRILVSCADRRSIYEPFGEIVAYTPATGKIDTLQRIGQPDSLHFNPHGIFLDKQSSPPLLYTISHERDQGFHPVYIWEVRGDSLIYSNLIYSPLVYSPNALTLGADGEIYIVNDCGKRGRFIEKVLKMRKANIVRMDVGKDGSIDARIVARRLGYPAGINRIGDQLYAGDAVLNRIHIYTISGDQLIKNKAWKGFKGNDNIRIHNGTLILAGHVKPFKYIGHVISQENKSPVRIWELDPATRNSKILFDTDGEAISAGSTGLLLDGNLYVSQVFDPFIIEVKMEQ